ncbi:MAG: hypothetical protein ACREBO_03635, partial [Novosphingobium sp.]
MHSLQRLSPTPRTILLGGAAAGVLLGALIAAITPTAMIYAPDPPWKSALPGHIAETAWVPTASAPEDPAPRFADAYGYGGAGWSFPPALRVQWQAPKAEFAPIPIYVTEVPAESEPADEAQFEVLSAARQSAEAAAAVASRAEPSAAEPAPPGEQEPVPAEPA